MTTDTLERWHSLVQQRNAQDIESLLADTVMFHSPVVHAPLAGKAIVSRYLAAAFHVFANDSFHYVRELVGSREAMLEFAVKIDGIDVNGVDILAWDEHGKIVDFKVMLRPLKAVNLIHQKMSAMLQANQ